MSELTATNCGCGCDSGRGGNNCCSIIWIILLLSCFCGGDGMSFFSNGSGSCGDGCGFGDNNCLWILLLLFCCGGMC